MKFKWHSGEDEFKIKIPKGTVASSSEAYINAVKIAFEQYRTSVAAARQAFLAAIAAARSTYLTPTTTPATNTAPYIVTAAWANPSLVTGNSTTLSVRAGDNNSESNLIYTWTTTSIPTSTANPTFGANNGTNSAKDIAITFPRAGVYGFMVTVKDASNLTVTSLVTVTVNQTLTSITLSPATTTVSIGSSTGFTGAAFDQFSMTQSSTFSWSVLEGILGGSIVSNGTNAGIYTATTTTGTFHIIGSVGSKSATSTVTVQ